MHYLCTAKQNNGTLAERLGNGLQNRVEQFDSARYLVKWEGMSFRHVLFLSLKVPLHSGQRIILVGDRVSQAYWVALLHESRWPPQSHPSGCADRHFDVVNFERQKPCLEGLKDAIWNRNHRRAAKNDSANVFYCVVLSLSTVLIR